MKKKKTTKGTKRTILIYLLILVVLYVVIYIVPQVSDIFVETYTAEYNTLQVTDKATCLFVRNEKTYTADSGGPVNREVKEGRLMREGAHIVDVGNKAYYSDMKGIISYYYDGLETTYTPDNMETLTSAVLDSLKEHTVSKSSSKEAASGDVIFKVVDNQKWYLVCWLGTDAAAKYQEGRNITVDFQDGENGSESTQLKMQISRMIPQGGNTMMILSCNRHYDELGQYRTRECVLIASNTSGIFLETDSIVEVDGQKGVYVVDKLGNYNFTPIRILDQDGDITVVEKNYFYNAEGIAVETVQNYFEILRPNAEALKENGEKTDREQSDEKKSDKTNSDEKKEE